MIILKRSITANILRLVIIMPLVFFISNQHFPTFILACVGIGCLSEMGSYFGAAWLYKKGWIIND